MPTRKTSRTASTEAAESSRRPVSQLLTPARLAIAAPLVSPAPIRAQLPAQVRQGGREKRAPQKP